MYFDCSYMASGARSSSPGHTTAPQLRLAWANSSGSRSLAKTPASFHDQARYIHRSLSPVYETDSQTVTRQGLNELLSREQPELFQGLYLLWLLFACA